MVGFFGKLVKVFEYLSGEAAIVLLIPVVLFFLFLVVNVQAILLGREHV